MSDTIPDIPLVPGQWNDIHTLSALPLNAKLVIRNRSQGEVYIALSSDHPLPDFTGGWDLLPREVVYITPVGSQRAWAFAKRAGNLYVQED